MKWLVLLKRQSPHLRDSKCFSRASTSAVRDDFFTDTQPRKKSHEPMRPLLPTQGSKLWREGVWRNEGAWSVRNVRSKIGASASVSKASFRFQNPAEQAGDIQVFVFFGDPAGLRHCLSEENRNGSRMETVRRNVCHSSALWKLVAPKASPVQAPGSGFATDETCNIPPH